MGKVGLSLKIAGTILVSVCALILVMFFRAEFIFQAPKHDRMCNETHQPLVGQDIVDRFAKALTFKTITYSNQNYNKEELARFGQFLRTSKMVSLFYKLLTLFVFRFPCDILFAFGQGGTGEQFESFVHCSRK